MNTQPTSPESAVLENQRAIATGSESIANLQGAISDYSGTADKMRAALPDMSALELERENLLASIAIGEKGQAELDALDARLGELRQQRQAAQPGITGIAQTIAGLNRRLGEAQAKLQQLQQDRPALVRRFLLAEAEAEGAQYAGLGVALAASYRRLRALDGLLSSAGHSTPIRAHGPELYVPAFALESVKPHAPDRAPGANYPSSIYDPRWDALGRDLAGRIDQEKTNFRAQGVEIE
jgi:uncharacterized coiled-coil protein SlyX